MNELYEKAMETRYLYRAGLITREEAGKLLKPYEEYYNSRCSELAKKYGQRAKRFSFNSFMR